MKEKLETEIKVDNPEEKPEKDDPSSIPQIPIKPETFNVKGFLTVLVFFGILFGSWYFIYLRPQIENPSTPSVTLTPTSVISQIPFVTLSPTPSISVDDSAYQVIDIEFTGIPLESEPLPLFQGDLINQYKFYRVGTVLSGHYAETNFQGSSYYIATDINNGSTSSPGFGIDLQVIKNNNQIFLINISEFYGLPGVPLDNVIVIDNTYYSINRSLDDPVLLFYELKDGYYQSKGIVTSDNGNHFTGSSLPSSTPFNSLQLIPVDVMGGQTIYLPENDTERNFVMRAKEGFAYVIYYQPPFTSEFLNEPMLIEWNNQIPNNSIYTFGAIGGCFGERMVTEEINESQISNTGKIGDELLYEYVNPQDEFRLKLYNEDYLGSDINQYNMITSDDSVPFTYEEYLQYHPVFYWQDPFGRYIRFVNSDFVLVGGCAKPAIYLYPEAQSQIDVRVVPNGKLTFSYPKMNDMWHVQADPTGLITSEGQEYPYLWWESVSNGFIIPKEGFMVNKDQLSSYFKETLLKIGFSNQEINDFIAYWQPKMEKENSNMFFVTYLLNSQVDQIGKLIINPTPAVVNRLFMLYKPVSENVNPTPLPLPTFTRQGFSVVEWGGAKIK